MKILLFVLLLAIPSTTVESIYEFSIEALNSDEEINLSDYKGKKILIVNVASKCGYTYQYEDLQKLYETYQDKLVIIGFPCNQFMGQESGDEITIQEFCRANYGVTFPMTTKIDVKGKDQHPIYKYLTSKSENGLGDFKVGWNFNKFLIDENGKLVAHFDSKVKPLDAEITSLLD